MSISSWKEEFYPVEANKDMTDKEALEHALLKFKGTTQENLEKHKVSLLDGSIISEEEDNTFSFDDRACSLCHKYVNNDCCGCPIYSIGECCNNLMSPYLYFCDNDDSQPMLETLQYLIDKHTS